MYHIYAFVQILWSYDSLRFVHQYDYNNIILKNITCDYKNII